MVIVRISPFIYHFGYSPVQKWRCNSLDRNLLALFECKMRYFHNVEAIICGHKQPFKNMVAKYETQFTTLVEKKQQNSYSAREIVSLFM